MRPIKIVWLSPIVGRPNGDWLRYKMIERETAKEENSSLHYAESLGRQLTIKDCEEIRDHLIQQGALPDVWPAPKEEDMAYNNPTVEINPRVDNIVGQSAGIGLPDMEPAQLVGTYHYVSIKKVANGFLIQISCKEFVAKTWDEASKGLAEYWKDPVAAEKKYVNE